jgi:uncharacterized protein DUF6702
MRSLLVALTLLAHPLHTTHTDLVEADGLVTVQVRAFTDDLTTAVRQRLGATDDSALARYVRGTVTLFDPDGRTVILAWAGKEVQGDITLLHFRAAGLTRLAGARIRQAMHMELFSDQVNVVQAKYGGQAQSLLFTPSDGPKRLP